MPSRVRMRIGSLSNSAKIGCAAQTPHEWLKKVEVVPGTLAEADRNNITGTLVRHVFSDTASALVLSGTVARPCAAQGRRASSKI